MALLEEMQKYSQGELIYIPKAPTNHEKWGANTDTKNLITQRNINIVQSFKAGISISELTEIYYLSEETIKKIVYRQTR